MHNLIKNHGDLFLVSLIMKFENDDADLENKDRDCLVWENLYLIRAKDIEMAFDKGVELGHTWCTDTGKCPDDINGGEGIWTFVGISELIPVYEDIEEGAELMWTNHGRILYKKTIAMTKSKDDWIKLRS